MVCIRGVDPSGKGVLTDESVDLEYVFTDGSSLVLETIVVPGLPEHLLYGLDWQSQTGVSIDLQEDPAQCYCQSKKRGFKELFISEVDLEYRRKLDSEANNMLHETSNSVQQERVRRVAVSFNDPSEQETDILPIFDLRSDPGKAREKDRR
jgi:hypothetical protein